MPATSGLWPPPAMSPHYCDPCRWMGDGLDRWLQTTGLACLTSGTLRPGLLPCLFRAFGPRTSSRRCRTRTLIPCGLLPCGFRLPRCCCIDRQHPLPCWRAGIKAQGRRNSWGRVPPPAPNKQGCRCSFRRTTGTRHTAWCREILKDHPGTASSVAPQHRSQHVDRA